MKMILTVATLLILFFQNVPTKPDAADPWSNVVISNTGKVIYKAEYFSNEEQRLTNTYIIVRNDDMSLRAVLYSDYADWRGSKWELINPAQYTREADTLLITSVDPDILAGLDEPPETFRNRVSVANPAVLFESNSIIKTKDLTVVVGDVEGQTVSGLVFIDVDKNRNQRIIVARKAIASTPGGESVPMQLNMSDVTLVSFDPQKKDDYDAITAEEASMNLY